MASVVQPDDHLRLFCIVNQARFAHTQKGIFNLGIGGKDGVYTWCGFLVGWAAWTEALKCFLFFLCPTSTAEVHVTRHTHAEVVPSSCATASPKRTKVIKTAFIMAAIH